MADPTQPPPEPSPEEQPPVYGGQPPAYGGQPPAYGGQPPANAGQPPMYGGPASMSPTSERTWMSAAHWSALVAAFVALAFLGPLIVMLTKGNESPRVRQQAVEALNFNISVLIYGVVSLVLVLVLIGIFMLVALGILWLVCTIMGAIKASNGEDYRYPLTIRLVN